MNNTPISVNTLPSMPISSGSNESKILSGPGAMPVRSAPPSSQDAVFSLGRKGYTRATGPPATNPFNNGKKQPTYILNSLYKNNGKKQTGKPIQTSASYSASSYMEARKRNAIGKGSRVSPGEDFAFMKRDRNVVNSALSKVRKIGAAAPPKRGFYAWNK